MGDPGDQERQEERQEPLSSTPPQASSLPSSRERLRPSLPSLRERREQVEGGNTEVVERKEEPSYPPTTTTPGAVEGSEVSTVSAVWCGAVRSV